MDTKLFNYFNEECLSIINDGDVLAFPTETVFGFGVVYDSVDAFNKMCALKNRLPSKPFTIMISRKEQIHEFVDVNEKIQRLIDKYMPGEITLLLPRKKDLPYHLTLNEPTVGIRMPNEKNLLSFISKVNKPLLVTSANMSNQDPLLNSDDVYQQFNGLIRGIVEGESQSNVPSTIVLINDDNINLIREGNIEFSEILKEWTK